jgi:hypothetical protein
MGVTITGETAGAGMVSAGGLEIGPERKSRNAPMSKSTPAAATRA